VRLPDASAYSAISESDRRFRLAVKRVVAGVLDRLADELDSAPDPGTAVRLLAETIRNEDAS
jgi:hypothetical protein